VGNPLQLTDPDGTDILTYDNLDRLSSVTRQVGGVTVATETYAYNALGALSINAGVAVDHQRPRLDGAGVAGAAVPATLGGQPVVLDAGGSITSLRGTTFSWERKGFLRGVQEPIPAAPIVFGVDSNIHRYDRAQGSSVEFYYFEGLDRVGIFDGSAIASGGPMTLTERYLFDGTDHPLRITQGAATTCYEVDLAGNVRHLFASGGADPSTVWGPARPSTETKSEQASGRRSSTTHKISRMSTNARRARGATKRELAHEPLSNRRGATTGSVSKLDMHLVS
jgi:YD repeat-containing protein